MYEAEQALHKTKKAMVHIMIDLQQYGSGKTN